MDAAELGAFLRSRRERLRPADVGLPGGAGRRAAGLRREEVAVLGGVGVSWLTRLEQGRANAVSPEVLGGLADALRLSAAERRHLFALGGARPPAAPVDGQVGSAAHRRLVDGLDPNPAYVLDHAWNLTCWNEAEAALFPVLRTASDPNLLRLTLAEPELRDVMSDWPEEVERLVRQFRFHLSTHPSREGESLADELSGRHPEFAVAWDRHDVAAFETQQRRFRHPDLGALVFDHHRLVLPDHPGWLVVIYTPADAMTADRFSHSR